MGKFSKVAVMIKLCIVLAMVQLSLGRETNRQRQSSGKNANQVATPEQLKALERVKPIDVANKEALDFAVDSMGNETGASFEDKVLIGISHWFVLREDVDISKFKQAYSRHVKDKCNKLKSAAAKQQRASGKGLSTPDQGKLEQKLAACEILLRKEVQCKIKSVLKDCGCRKSLKHRTGAAMMFLLGSAGILACVLGVAYSPTPSCFNGGSGGDDDNDDHDDDDSHH